MNHSLDILASDHNTNLGELEHKVMLLVWQYGPVTSETIRRRLPRDLKESTVRTVLRRLGKKGYVVHALIGRSFLYQATEERAHVAAKAVGRIIDLFCDGSVEELFAGLISTRIFDGTQLSVLIKMIEQQRSGSNDGTTKLPSGINFSTHNSEESNF